jgi:hypothetical protein
LPVNVNVQVFALLPPLEHAPDQTTSRLLVDRSVMDVPVVNDADPLLPTATSIPAGVEVTRSPPRPVAVTVSVAAWPGGATVSVVVLVTPPAAAVIVTAVDVVTGLVETVNVALVAPWATVTLAGTLADVLVFESDTTKPPAGAGAVSVTVPCAVWPPVTLDGETDTAESAAATGVELAGMNRLTDDHGPAVPAELIARTRHQCRRAAKVGAVSCDAVTVRSRTNGEEKVLASSTWIR